MGMRTATEMTVAALATMNMRRHGTSEAIGPPILAMPLPGPAAGRVRGVAIAIGLPGEGGRCGPRGVTGFEVWRLAYLACRLALVCISVSVCVVSGCLGPARWCVVRDEANFCRQGGTQADGLPTQRHGLLSIIGASVRCLS